MFLLRKNNKITIFYYAFYYYNKTAYIFYCFYYITIPFLMQ